MEHLPLAYAPLLVAFQPLLPLLAVSQRQEVAFQPLLPLLAVSQRQEVAFQPLLPLLAVSQRQEVAFQRQERQERQELFRQAQVKIRTKGNRATGLVYGALTLVIPSCLTKRYKLFTLLNKIH